jgi:phosphatidylethanolamine-binding protein (PEBP) family uncharacterized protein
MVDISLTTSVSVDPLPRRYTCDGADTSLPLRWRNLPRHVAELDLFVLSAEPVRGHYVVAWALAGIPPGVHSLSAGRLPDGVVIGHNTTGRSRYSVCPPKGGKASYAVLLFAVPHHVTVKEGFNAEALVEATLESISRHEGELSFSYTRPAS